MKTIELRCSKLPLALACPASLNVDALQIGGDTEPADEGSAAHEIITGRIAGGDPDIMETAMRWGVDGEVLDKVVGQSWYAWRRIADRFPAPLVEQAFDYDDPDGFSLTGHIDILSLIGPRTGDDDWDYQTVEEARFADAKTGRLEEEHEQQMTGYAFLVAKRYNLRKVYGTVFKTQFGIEESRYYDLEELEAWWSGVKAKLRNRDLYVPGPHQCRRCQRAWTCPARRQVAQESIAVLEGFTEPGADIADVLPTEVAARAAVWIDLLERAKLVLGIVEMAKGMAKADVSLHGCQMATNDGRELILREETHRKIVYETGCNILLEELGLDTVLKLLKIGKGDVEKAVSDRCGRGQKGKAIKALLERLSVAGALTAEIVEKLEVRRNGNTNTATAITHARDGEQRD